MPESALSVSSLSKAYGRIPALAEVSFEVRPGLTSDEQTAIIDSVRRF